MSFLERINSKWTIFLSCELNIGLEQLYYSDERVPIYWKSSHQHHINKDSRTNTL
jgi:hypothetical protein